MIRIDWKLSFRSPRVHGKRFMPKRPVNWKGEMWMSYPCAGGIEVDSREWRSMSPLTKDEALDVLRAQLSSIIEDSGQGAVDAGFWLEVV